jgi:hypothetical protein
MNNAQIKNRIKNKIAKAKKGLAPLTPEIETLARQYREVMDKAIENENPTDAEKDLLKKCFEAMSTLNRHNEIKMLTDASKLNLFYCPKKYLVTDSKEIFSPSGFGMEERVFAIKGNVMLSMDDTKNAPSSNVELRAFDIDAEVRRWA